MIKELLIAIGIVSPPSCAGMSIKDCARQVYFEQEQARNPNFTDRAMIHDSKYNPGTLNPDGTTDGREGSQFEYEWAFYQGYKSNPAAPLTVMAGWEREAIKRGAK